MGPEWFIRWILYINSLQARSGPGTQRPARFTRHTSGGQAAGGENEYELNIRVFSVMRLRRIKKAIIKNSFIILVPCAFVARYLSNHDKLFIILYCLLGTRLSWLYTNFILLDTGECRLSGFSNFMNNDLICVYLRKSASYLTWLARYHNWI